MRIRVNPKTFTSAIKIVNFVPSTENFNGIMLIPNNNKLSILKSNGSISITVNINCSIEDDSELQIFSIDDKKLSIINTNENNLDIQLNKSSVKFIYGDSYTSIPIISIGSNYEKIVGESRKNAELVSEVDQFPLIHISDMCYGNMRPVFNSVRIVQKNNKLMMYSSNGIEVYYKEKEIVSGKDFDSLIPQSNFKTIEKLFNRGFSIYKTNSHTIFKTDNIEVVSSEINGDYADTIINNVKNGSRNIIASSVNKQNLIDICKRCSSLMSNNETRGINLLLNDKIRIECKTQSGEIDESVEGEVVNSTSLKLKPEQIIKCIMCIGSNKIDISTINLEGVIVPIAVFTEPENNEEFVSTLVMQ